MAEPAVKSETSDSLPELSEDDLTGSVKSYLDQVKSGAERLHREEKDPTEAIRFRTESMDRLLRALFETALRLQKKTMKKSFHVTLIAQGGYGRQELCLHSDIDILLLYEGKGKTFLKFLHDKIFQTLWDAGLELGYAIRTVRDCRRLMESDMTILTSLLDVRYLAGNRTLSKKLTQTLDRYFSSKRRREKFVKKKLAENREREKRYGGSVYLLEPNLKESEGGLRDFHTLYWFGRIYEGIRKPQELVKRRLMTQEDFDEVWTALQFLWRTRNELHRSADRRSDQLFMEFQESVAKALGFETKGQILGVEIFMQQYYREAATIRTLCYKAIRRLQRTEPKLFPPPQIPVQDSNLRVVDGKLTVASQDLFERDPIYLLRIFQVARKLDLEMDDVAQDCVRRSLSFVTESLQKDPQVTSLILEMLSDFRGIETMLSRMNDLQVLGAFLPEFGKLQFRVQHNLYHVYTVDVHSIFAVAELEKIDRGDYERKNPTVTRIVREMTDPRQRAMMAFALLYHDVGKGEGPGHVERGAPLIRARARQLGFSQSEVEDLEFLERSHLIMTHVAFRRDLDEQNLIIKFARAINSAKILDSLYVLTFCDVKAANPEAMTDWKAALLETLFVKTRVVLENGLFEKEKVSTLVPRALDEALKLFETDKDQQKCREFFEIMPARYLIATPPVVMKRHVGLWENFDTNPIVFDVQPLERENVHEVTLLTWESPALFSRVAGIFAAHNINIIEAQLHLSTRGHALHMFKVTDQDGRMIDDQGGRWERVEQDLRDVVEGRVAVVNLVAEKFKPSLFKKKVARVLPNRVAIDNDVSAYYTVIDILTQDRIGLLYQITSVLAALGLYVDVSKISTRLDQVADTFYVKDIFGHKITSEQRIKRIREVLEALLEEQPTPGWRPPKY